MYQLSASKAKKNPSVQEGSSIISECNCWTKVRRAIQGRIGEHGLFMVITPVALRGNIFDVWRLAEIDDASVRTRIVFDALVEPETIYGKTGLVLMSCQSVTVKLVKPGRVLHGQSLLALHVREGAYRH